MLIDSHCHLTDAKFGEDRRDVLLRAAEAGIEGIVSVASHLEDAREVAGLLQRMRGLEGVPRIWGTAGVHPHDAEEAREGDLDGIRDLLQDRPGMVAVGETGLDFFYDNSPRERQEELYFKH